MAITSNNGRLPTIVKWAGGKKQLLGQFKQYFPDEIDRYFEPFLGSGAVFFYVKKEYDPKEVILSDKLEELINCYKIVRDNVDDLIEALNVHKKNHSPDYYKKIRAINPEDLDEIENAARFLYLNKTCWNGLYRVNSLGQFNVPMSDKRTNNGIVNEQNLKEASRLLEDVELKVLSYEKILKFARPHDFIYLDPPYYPLSKTSSFTSYTAESFSEDDQRELSEVYKKLHDMGCHLMLSNSDHEFIKELYQDYHDFRIETVDARRMINCNAKKRGIVKELVVLNDKIWKYS